MNKIPKGDWIMIALALAGAIFLEILVRTNGG